MVQRRRVAQPDNSTTHHAHAHSRTAPRHQRRDLGVRALLASSARHGACACGEMGRGSIRPACMWQAPGRIRAAAHGAECVLALLNRHARADPHAMTRRALIGPAAIVRVRRRCDRGGSTTVARGGLPAAVACLPDADERNKQRSDDENRTSHPASALLGCGGESLRSDPAPMELRAASATRSCDRRLGSAPKPQLNQAAQRARRRRAIDVHTRVEEVRLLSAC